MISNADPSLDLTVGVDGGNAIPTSVGIGSPVSEPIDNNTPTINPDCGNITIGCFFGTIQESVTIVWRYHLKTRKYSAHIALNDFYDDAVDIIDDMIEQYQGIKGIIEDPFINTICSEGKDEVLYLNELKGFINTHKCMIDDSEVLSTIDEFLGLIDSTLYKLNNLTEHCVKSYDEFCYEDYNIEEEE